MPPACGKTCATEPAAELAGPAAEIHAAELVILDQYPAYTCCCFETPTKCCCSGAVTTVRLGPTHVNRLPPEANSMAMQMYSLVMNTSLNSITCG